MRLFRALNIGCLLCLLLLLPAALQAQLTYTTNIDGSLNISGYTGLGGALVIPGTNGGLLVTSIGDSVFSGSGLTSVTIPSTITSIGNQSFYFCQSLTTVYFQGNPPTLGSQTFGSFVFSFPAFRFSYPNCYYSPGTVGWGSTFGGCPVFMWDQPYVCTPANGTITIVSYTDAGASTLVIPDTIDGLPVSTIGNDAFSGGSMASITFPQSIVNIGDDAFEGCGNLTNICFPSSGGITIGNWSFLGCYSLTSITIPNSVTRIGYYAFGQCTALTNVMISSAVSGIGQFAFLGCINLISVYFAGNAPGADWTVFMNDNQTVVYYLPGTIGWGSTFGGSPTVQWWLPNPLILNNSSSLGVQSNGFGFIISWATNTSVIVEASTDFSKSNWLAVATNTLISGWSQFNDPQWMNFPARFYRLRAP